MTMKRTTVLAIFSVTILHAERAHAGMADYLFAPKPCMVEGVPEIVVLAETPTYRIDRSLESKDIGRVFGNAEAFARHGQYVPGLTVGNFVSSGSYETSSWSLGNGRWCTVLDRVTVKIGLKEPVRVYVDSALPEQGCAYREILKHEMLHVGAFGRSVREGKARVTASMLGFLTQSPPAAEAFDLTLSKQTVIDEAEAMVTKSVEEVIAFSAQINARIDTPEEYDRVQGACHDWLR